MIEGLALMIDVGEFDLLPSLGLKLSLANWTLFCFLPRNCLHKFYTFFEKYFVTFLRHPKSLVDGHSSATVYAINASTGNDKRY